MGAIGLLSYVALCLSLPDVLEQEVRTEISLTPMEASAALVPLTEGHPILEHCQATSWRYKGSGSIEAVEVSFEGENGIQGVLHLHLEAQSGRSYLVESVSWSLPFFQRGWRVLNGPVDWPLLDAETFAIETTGNFNSSE